MEAPQTWQGVVVGAARPSHGHGRAGLEESGAGLRCGNHRGNYQGNNTGGPENYHPQLPCGRPITTIYVGP